jgi:hypothetical protein
LKMWMGDHSQEDLAKFGYRSERKIKTFWNPNIYIYIYIYIYILATCKNKWSKYDNFNFFFLDIWQLWGIFSLQNPFVQVTTLYLSPSDEISWLKKTHMIGMCIPLFFFAC